ncbi:MAG: twin-arginine translocase TatA/TatE family subunit [Acidobacteriota bacterium]
MIGPLGLPELIFILLLALLIFGPRKLPEIGRTLGRAMAEFRRATAELKRTIDAEVIEEEIRQARQELKSHDPRTVVRDTIANAENRVRTTVDDAIGRSPNAADAQPDAEATTTTDAAAAPSDDDAASGDAADDDARPIRTEAPPSTVARGSVTADPDWHDDDGALSPEAVEARAEATDAVAPAARDEIASSTAG